MLLKIVYLLTRRILGLAALISRRGLAMDAELLVLRHENAVLRRATCRTGDLRRNQPVGGCRCGLPLAERLRQVTRPLATPLALRPRGTLRPLEDVLALLTAAGFSGSDALHIYRALFGFLHGHVLNELQELVDNPDETDDLLRLGLYRLPPGEFPLLRSLAPVLAAYDGAAELERGLDILLTGLTTTLTPQAK